MDQFLAFSTTFESSHRQHRGIPWKDHGHSFRIEITTVDPNDWTLREDMIDVARELDLHPLEEMLAGGNAGPHGLAIWFIERLQLGHPKIVRAEVSETAGERAIVTREIRGPVK